MEKRANYQEIPEMNREQLREALEAEVGFVEGLTRETRDYPLQLDISRIMADRLLRTLMARDEGDADFYETAYDRAYTGAEKRLGLNVTLWELQRVQA